MFIRQENAPSAYADSTGIFLGHVTKAQFHYKPETSFTADRYPYFGACSQGAKTITCYILWDITVVSYITILNYHVLKEGKPCAIGPIIEYSTRECALGETSQGSVIKAGIPAGLFPIFPVLIQKCIF